MHKQLTLILFLSMLLACKKESQVPVETPSGELRQQQTEVQSFQVATLTSDNISFSSESYEGNIGGIPVTLSADKESGVLAFFVPELPAGTAQLKVHAEGQDFSFNYQINASAPIADPAAVIEIAMEDLTFSDQELDNIHENIKNLEGNEFSAQHIGMLKQYTAYVNQLIIGLGDEEKKELAAFIQANKELFTPGIDPSQYIDSFSLKKSGQTPEQMIDQVFENLKEDRNTLLLIAGLTMVSGATGNVALASIFGLAGIYKIYLINGRTMAGLDRALMRFGQVLADEIRMGKAAPLFNFNKNQKFVIRIRSAYRNPNKDDLSSTAALVKGIIVSLDVTENVWEKANTFISKFGFKLEGSPYHIKNISKTKSKIFPVNPQFIFLTNISNPKVDLVNWEAVEDGWEVEFSSDEPGTHNFTFDIMYKSSSGEDKLTFEAALVEAANVTTVQATSIDVTSAVVGGEVLSDGGSTITARGICYGTLTNPSVNGSKTTSWGGTGTFFSTLSNLKSETLYYARAYATNSSGTVYGNEISFTTLAYDSMGIYKQACEGNWTMTWGGGADQVDKFTFYSDGTGIYYWMKPSGSAEGSAIDPGNAVYDIIWSVTKLGVGVWRLNINYPNRGWNSNVPLFLYPTRCGEVLEDQLYFLGTKD